MNDFSEIESELKKLRPAEPSPQLFARIEAQLEADAAEKKVIRPARFRISWLSLGAGLAAAAVLLLFSYWQFNRFSQRQTAITAASPTQHDARSTTTTETRAAPEFVPAHATEVVYRTEDEGLLFPSGSEQPMRRVRSQTRETFQWRNPNTGASLRVSYPREEVSLVPVTGQ
jgi:hypothetical protein